METKVAVVTGGTRGIGFEITRGLVKNHGYHVLFTSRSAEAGEATVQKLGENGADVSKVSFFVVDVTEEDGALKVANHVREKFGTVHALVNNAGVLLDDEIKIADVPVELVSKSFEINTIGPLRFIQAFLPFFKEANYGRIVNVSSALGCLHDMEGTTTGYKVSKAALNAVTRIVADEVKDLNILVNSMSPGFCKTDMTGGDQSPATRTAEEGAATAIFLATVADDGPRGKFIRDDLELKW